jgi:hypothetical protein
VTVVAAPAPTAPVGGAGADLPAVDQGAGSANANGSSFPIPGVLGLLTLSVIALVIGARVVRRRRGSGAQS